MIETRVALRNREVVVFLVVLTMTEESTASALEQLSYALPLQITAMAVLVFETKLSTLRRCMNARVCVIVPAIQRIGIF